MSRLLNKQEYSLFESILSSTQEGIKDSMKVLLEEYYGTDNLIATDEYIVAMGTVPIAIVAHMDTVHREPVKELFYDKEKNVMWSPEGIGADDRAGIYSMIEILRRGYTPTLILTTDEEVGGRGAAKLIADLSSPPCQLNYIVELDRRGFDDCVFYDCDNEEFEDYIEDFGFKTNWGSFSDISYICPAWRIAGVNLSIGYEDEHTYSERLYVDAMFNTISKVCNMFDALDYDKDKFIYIKSETYFRGYGYDYSGCDNLFEAYGYGSVTPTEKEEICWDCLGVFKKEEVEILKDNGDATYCKDCYNKRYTTCIDCGTPFEDILKVHLKCNNCRG